MINVVIFGTGGICEKIQYYFTDKVNIVAYLDNNESKWNSLFKGKKIISPEKILEISFEYIIIASSYYSEIYEQLIGMGILKKYIINYKDESLLCNLQICSCDLQIISNQSRIFNEIQNANKLYETNLFLNAKLLTNNMLNKESIKNIQDAEFKVFSQWGEDGIIQYIINNIDIKNKFFIEFGVENYIESNTRFLLCNNNWQGLIMDGSESNIEYIKNDEIYWKYNLNAVCEFITKENINSIIKANCTQTEIGLLSIDVDGVDYWIWKEIDCINPIVVVCEYNAVFGDKLKVTVPYEKSFFRTEKHYSNLYWGASLQAFIELGKEKGYSFIGSNSAGNNAFFIKNEYYDSIGSKINEVKYSLSHYRESRDKHGKLTFLSGEDRLEEIKKMEIYNLDDSFIQKIEEVYKL